MSIDNLWTAGGIVSIPLLGFSLLAIAKLAEGIALIIEGIILLTKHYCFSLNDNC